MTKQKKSFFEKLTGIKKVEEKEEDIEINKQQNFANYEKKEEDYEFPQNNNSAFEEEDFEDDIEQEVEQNLNYNEMEKVNQNKQTPIQSESNSAESGMVDSEGQLTIDVYQTDDDVVIKSTIAGVKPEDLDVNINSDMVTIRGERKQEEEIDGENYYYQECYWGSFSRSVILPVEIITEKAEATMKNGILTIRLPKADVTKTRKIQVRGF